MESLSNEHYQALWADYQDSAFFFPIIGAVIERKQPGVIFTDCNDQPKCFLIIHQFGFSQYVGSDSSSLLQDFELLISGENQSWRALVPNKIRLYAPGSNLAGLLSVPASRKMEKSERMQMRLACRHAQQQQFDDSLDRLEVKKIGLVDIDAINDQFPIALDTRFWASADSFIQNGLGMMIKLAENPTLLSLCYSAAISNNIAEIDIITADQHKKKGYARQVASAFITECNKQGLTVNWDCYTNNLPSCKLAMKLGFRAKVVYEFYTINLQAVPEAHGPKL